MKRTLVNSVVAGVLATATLVLATGCGKSNMSKEDKALYKQLDALYGKQEKFIDPATGKPYDFGGIEITMADWWSNPEGADKVPAKTKKEEDTRNWHKYLQLTYNFKLTEKGIGSWDTHPQSVANFCVVGGEENYVYVIDLRSVTPAIKAELYYDWANSGVDLTQKKYDDATTELMTKRGKIYGVRPMLPEPRTGVFFNKRILQEANIDPDYIYDLQRDGNWTWETFEDVLKKVTRDIDNDGVIDVWGMSNHDTEAGHLILASNGASIIGRDANGNYFNNAESQASIEAFEWAAKMHSKYEMPKPEGAEWNWMYAAFMNGQTAFMMEQEYFVDTLANMADDWGFVCCPKGPRVDDYKCVNVDNIYVIPAIYGDEKCAQIAKAFDIYMTQCPGYNDDEAWKEDYYAKFRDDRAVDETLALMQTRGSTMLSKLIPGLEAGDVIWGAYQGWATVQERLDAVRNSWDGLIKEVNR